MRDKLVLTGAAVAVALTAFVAVTPWLTPWPFDGETQDLVHRAGLAAVPAVALLVVLRRASAARLACGFAVPALLLGSGAWDAPGGEVTYTLTVETLTAGSSALSPAGELVNPPPEALEAALTVAFLVLLTLLWVLATVGLLTVARRRNRPTVSTLAVVAALLTVPLWVPPGPRWSTAAGPMTTVPATAVLDATRLTALALVLVLGGLVLASPRGLVLASRRGLVLASRRGLVLASRRPVPARAAAYVVPALALSWVWWRTEAGGRFGVAGSSTWLEPSFADRLPWTVTSVAETALVVVLWLLAFLGSRELVARYRPPDAVPVSPSGR